MCAVEVVGVAGVVVDDVGEQLTSPDIQGSPELSSLSHVSNKPQIPKSWLYANHLQPSSA